MNTIQIFTPEELRLISHRLRKGTPVRERYNSSLVSRKVEGVIGAMEEYPAYARLHVFLNFQSELSPAFEEWLVAFHKAQHGASDVKFGLVAWARQADGSWNGFGPLRTQHAITKSGVMNNGRWFRDILKGKLKPVAEGLTETEMLQTHGLRPRGREDLCLAWNLSDKETFFDKRLKAGATARSVLVWEFSDLQGLNVRLNGEVIVDREFDRGILTRPRLIPDWELGGDLVLVWPGIRHGDLTEWFAGLLNTLRSWNRTILILTKSESQSAIAGDFLRGQGVELDRVRFLELPTLSDIWIRDWAPLWTKRPTGEWELVKPIYSPAYLAGADQRLANGDERAGRELAARLGVRLVDLPLIWDGGNLTHNGKGVAIATKRLLRDNLGKSEAEIRNLLQDSLGIMKLVLVPEEPDDDTGHVDGMARFVSADKLVVGAYPPGTPDASFMDDVAVELERELGPGFAIHRIMNLPFDGQRNDGVASAVGNYINFLRSGDEMLLPIFGRDEDAPAVETIKKVLQMIIYPGMMIATPLARLGGVLNCAIWSTPAHIVVPQGEAYSNNHSKETIDEMSQQ